MNIALNLGLVSSLLAGALILILPRLVIHIAAAYLIVLEFMGLGLFSSMHLG